MLFHILTSLPDKMDTSMDLDPSEHFIEHSTAPQGTIPAEQGRSLIDEHDPDVSNAGHDLNDLLQRAYSVSQSHIIALKKRLLEEKRIEMLELERKYLNHVDQLNNEIQQLQKQISDQHTELGDSRETKEKFSFKAAASLSKYGTKYSGPVALSKVFRAWREETKGTLRSNKLDKVAFAFARKHILSKAFFTMCLNLHVRKANKQNAEAKFKFDSVTSEMISSYESQLHAMKVDLREAYLSIEAEQWRRQQLEEDLRRLFLKNMTAMNFEALSLFQNSHTMVDAVPVPAAVAPVVEIGSPPKPVRRDLNHTPRQASGNKRGNSGSSVPRAASTPLPPQHSPQAYSHQHYVPHQLYENHHEPYSEQMDRQVEQLISSTHTHIPNIHAHSLHAPNVRSPPVSTPQPPHPFSSSQFSLESESAMFYYGESKDVPFTPTSPHGLSQVYHSNISSTNKLAHNIRSNNASFSHATPSAQNEEDETQVNSGRKSSPHTTRTGSSSARKSVNSTSVQNTPASTRKANVGSGGKMGSAVKRTPSEHVHKD